LVRAFAWSLKFFGPIWKLAQNLQQMLGKCTLRLCAFRIFGIELHVINLQLDVLSSLSFKTGVLCEAQPFKSSKELRAK